MARPQALELLRSSDIDTVGVSDERIQTIYDDFDVNRCLNFSANDIEAVIAMRAEPSVLRDMLAEESYLAQNRRAPALHSAGAPLEFKPAATNPNPQKANALMAFADCAVRRDVVRADALLRTMPASPQERKAAAALAQALGSCLLVGQQFTLKPDNIRTLIAFAMWARFGRSR
jgi:hypothetical protein